MRRALSNDAFDPTNNGISAYRWLLTSAHFRCEENVGNDNLYAAHVQRLRRLAMPSIRRHKDAWKRMRDGSVDDAGEYEPGFYVGPDGKPLRPGQPVPKEVYMDMEGAVHEILHLDGMYWIKPKNHSKMLDKYRQHLGANDDPEEEEDVDDIPTNGMVRA